MIKKNKILEIKKNWKNLIWWRNIFLWRLFLPLVYSFDDGFFVLDEKWDYLIILDACRYDVFKKIIKKFNLKGKLEYKKSRGCDTYEFFLNNFKGKKLKDIIYITANPITALCLKNEFYKIVHVWKENWSKKYNTVLPSEIYRKVIQIRHSNPNKRLIIHFMQPHFPFIGDPKFGKEEMIFFLQKAKSLRVKKIINKQRKEFWKIVPFQLYLNFTNKKYFKLYEKNLEIVMSWVKKILKILRGRIVITSDHGIAFGEKFLFFQVFGHAKKVRIPHIKYVPWFIIEK
jgi:hypothetical protein